MLKAKDRLGIIFFPAYDWAISPTHPEREERLLYTQDQLREEGIFDIDGITEHKPDIALPEDVTRVHFLIPNVVAVTTESHLISAGGAIRAARLVMEGTTEKAFALVRPPGHHAMKVVHGNRGFCNINIEAIMIEHIREHYGQKRIAVVDTDCHHGDGTQDIYWHDPNTLFISMHQDGRTLYPGTGFIEESGGPNARNRTINIPLPPETCDEGFISVIDNVVLPILADFKPDLIVNSAGQDNHYSDPITNMKFTARGYALLNRKLNPNIAVLEGGYSIQGALPYVNCGIALAMAGLDFDNLREPDYDEARLRQAGSVTERIKQVNDKVLERYFKPLRSGQFEPGSFVTREKNIFYDTDMIREHQRESVMACEKCAGLLVIETTSTINDLSVCIEIPIGACDHCRDEGLSILDEARRRGHYSHIKFINRRDKIYSS
ncbi:MAG TPA: histone deacetylase [Dissulfurispiraceae bacterium]|nr:histone deacetylase [Dissulfurispiraceae bacterium]